MPQDVTFDLPFDTPISRQQEYAQERRLRSPASLFDAQQEPEPVA